MEGKGLGAYDKSREKLQACNEVKMLRLRLNLEQGHVWICTIIY